MSVLRAGVLATIIVCVAGFLSQWFGLPEYHLYFQLVAVVPLIRGLQSLSIYIEQRHLKFTSQVVVEVAGQILGFIAGVISAFVLANHVAVLIAILAHSIGMTVFSHFLAKETFIVKPDRHYLPQVRKFGFHWRRREY